MLRLTAKATQFGHRTFTSWLIESAGTIPLKRRKDYAEGDADNTEAVEKLLQVGGPIIHHWTSSPILFRLWNWVMRCVFSQRG